MVTSEAPARYSPFKRVRLVLVFFAYFVVVFGLLMIPWSGVRTAYASALRGSANLFLSWLGPVGRCRFVPHPGSTGAMDTNIELTNLRTRETSIRPRTIGSRHMGYIPTAFVAALMIATPVSLRRKTWALLWGLLAAHVFVMLRLAITVLRDFTLPGDMALFSPGPLTDTLIQIGFVVFAGTQIGGFIVPILIWAVVSFRRSDWENLMRGGRSAVAPPRGPAAAVAVPNSR